MSAEKRVQNWILVIIVLVIAISAPLYKISRGEPAVNQGIDLVGGVDLTLKAGVPEGEEELTQDMMLGAIDIVRNRLDPEGVREIIIQQMGDDRIVVQIPGEDDPERVRDLIGETAILRFIDAGHDQIPAGTRIRFIDPETGEPVQSLTLTQDEPEEEPEPIPEMPGSVVMSEQILFNPVDMVGFVVNPIFQDPENPEALADPEGRFEVSLALEQIPAGTNLAVQTTQNRGSYLVLLRTGVVLAAHEITDPLTRNQISFPGLADEEGFDVAILNQNLEHMQVALMAPPPPVQGSVVEIWDPMAGAQEPEVEEGIPDVVDVSLDQIILTGDDFANAEVRFNQIGQPTIGFEFKAGGREVFGRHTATHVQQFLAIALDDIIISCPVIREPILHGRGVIEGSFTQQEAGDLVVQLDSGRLPVKLTVIENRTVGPTLGAKSIAESKRAAVLGAVLILLFMLIYYRLPGLAANIALLYYAVVFFGALAVLNATLTLPGIAGFILSVGMAVDANVIIFERLKEELKTGKTFRSAVEAAFKRAFLAIFDANVTTLITALVLYNLGTGPIKGFAVTLSLGILVSMFSALVFTRLLLETALGSKAIQKYAWFGVKEKDVAGIGTGGDVS